MYLFSPIGKRQSRWGPGVPGRCLAPPSARLETVLKHPMGTDPQRAPCRGGGHGGGRRGRKEECVGTPSPPLDCSPNGKVTEGCTRMQPSGEGWGGKAQSAGAPGRGRGSASPVNLETRRVVSTTPPPLGPGFTGKVEKGDGARGLLRPREGPRRPSGGEGPEPPGDPLQDGGEASDCARKHRSSRRAEPAPDPAPRCAASSPGPVAGCLRLLGLGASWILVSAFALSWPTAPTRHRPVYCLQACVAL